ncbi:MOSC domain-containing protein YiiM [Rhizomicrobium palustre]|uniref:MOSC domain-containing protein YiiM n=1 Tax=Rhizomicrobium palustre TaxID=189966 RepID=A0A846N038_9PROT|nr:MOSC domain-containing protein [Rhizomicrobium palustre]NIK88622.1 MOSC domain-containing protein YiiM [Rhizomicrobium palustre]
MNVPILSLAIGQPKPLGVWRGEEVLSGFDKQPVTEEHVFVTATGIRGDGQADLENHGGADKAVYAYPALNWPWWENEKRLACRPGLFGENLTLGEVDETNVYLGDRFSWGDVILEVSQPRAPCFKLAMYTGRPEIPAAMTLSGRCGWYFRVVQEGEAPSRGALTRLVCTESVTVRDAFSYVFTPKPDVVMLERIKHAPGISDAWLYQVSKRIAAANG